MIATRVGNLVCETINESLKNVKIAERSLLPMRKTIKKETQNTANKPKDRL